MVACFALLGDLYTHNLIKSVGCGGWVDKSSKLCGRSKTLREVLVQDAWCQCAGEDTLEHILMCSFYHTMFVSEKFALPCLLLLYQEKGVQESKCHWFDQCINF